MSKKRKPQSLLSVFSEAMAIHEKWIPDVVRTHLDAKSRAENASKDVASFWDDEPKTIDDLIVAEGVAVIPIHGMMTKRGWWWCCGSDHWSEMITNITARLDIPTIILDFDTGGGQVAGTELLGDAVWKARQAGKNTIAVVNEFCASAGLWVASQCERIVIPATGNLGSLGVYTMHFDDTKFLAENWGIEKSVIYRGTYKAVHERPLDEDGKADLQRGIDAKYSLFVDAVARGRGLRPEEVMERWGDARLFSGSEAVSNGLADEIGTLQDVLESLRAGRGGRVSIEVPPANDCDPETDPEGDPLAMKLNAQGQILDSAGKVVGTLAELQLDAAAVQKHFSEQASALTAAAVKAAQDSAAAEAEASKKRLEELVAAVGPEKGLAAWKDGKTVEGAKAAMADELAATLKARDEEVAKLKADAAQAAAQPAAGTKAPVFAASDAGGLSDGKKVDATEDKDQPFAADWQANKDNCQSDFGGDFKAFAAYRRSTSPR